VAFLDSAAPAGGLGRWSILGVDPHDVLAAGDGAAPGPAGTPDPFDALDARLRGAARPDGAARSPRHQAVPGPFRGGAIGFLSYDLGRKFERLPTIAIDDLRTPDFWFGFYDLFLVFEHDDAGDPVAGWIVSTGDPASGEAQRARAAERLLWLRQRLDEMPARIAPFACGTIESTHTRASYKRAVRTCLDWIAAGHVYQVNLSQRFAAPFEGDPRALYLALRRANPAPFAAYLDTGARQVLSSSPERFLRVDGDRIETRPIKGTRPRGATEAEDRRLRSELLASPKDRAELVMIVDLERNDLGRVCRFGSVVTGSIARLETYETVHHLVGLVHGRLRPGTSLCDVVRAAFPGGSITGAPKIRAMEIIEGLEPVRRGVYCGAIGMLGLDGRADLNIAIRTAVVQDARVHVSAGGGIVADSDPDLEYEETLHKAAGLLRALGAREPAVVDP
jgi:para-aminobenzoate synthetase component 1